MSSPSNFSDRPSMRLIPLRTILVVPFVLQIFAAVGFVGYLSFRNGQRSVNDLAAEIRTQVSDRAKQYLENYLEKPHIINQWFGQNQGLMARRDCSFW